MASDSFKKTTCRKKPSSVLETLCFPFTNKTFFQDSSSIYQEKLEIANKEANQILENLSVNSSPLESNHVPGQEITFSQAELQPLKWELLRQKWRASDKHSSSTQKTSPLHCKENPSQVSNRDSKTLKNTEADNPAQQPRYFDCPTLKFVLCKGKFYDLVCSLLNSVSSVTSQGGGSIHNSPTSSSTISEWKCWFDALPPENKYNVYRFLINPEKKIKHPIPLPVAITILMLGWKKEGLCDPPKTDFALPS